jgi:metallophosphoesterase superfamily enzyme
MTPAQREALDAYNRHGGNQTAAARELGLARSSFQERLARARRFLAAPEGQQAAITAAGLDITTATHGWRVVPREDGGRDSVFWKAPATDTGFDPAQFAADLRDHLEALPRAAPATKNPAASLTDCLAIYPVADLHLGLLTHAEEAGTEWNTAIATATFHAVQNKVIEATPPTAHAMLVNLGDLMHHDDTTNQTFKSKHNLDVDQRYHRTLLAAFEAMRNSIEALRTRHTHVTYRGQRGNHDERSHEAVTLALTIHYANTPDVTIVPTGRDIFVDTFGTNMIAFHHGDSVPKLDRLAMYLASDYPEEWGRTRHRFAFSGHLHHDRRQSGEIGGVIFETCGTIAPRDAYARRHGYTARRGLTSLTLHKDDGEISRVRRPAP